MVATEMDVSKVAVLVQQGGHLLDHTVVDVAIAGKFWACCTETILIYR